jgi:hypothetical protein
MAHTATVRSDNVLSREAAMFGRSQQMGIIGKHFAETGFGRRRQMEAPAARRNTVAGSFSQTFRMRESNVRTLLNPSESAPWRMNLQGCGDRQRNQARFVNIPLVRGLADRIPVRRDGYH